MKILLIAHTYAPAANGVAQIVTQLAETLAKRGHRVTVATQHHHKRQHRWHNGVEVRSFDITGNAVAGIKGQLKDYQDFIQNGDWDVQHHHGCQIWGFDALFEWLKQQKNRKIVVTPHGFSQLQNPAWQNYFADLRQLLPHIHHFTSLSAQSEEAKFLETSVANWQVISNGIWPEEFLPNVTMPTNLREKWGINERFWLLNVSNHVSTKGHKMLHQLARQFPEATVSNLGQPIAAERWGLGKWGLKLPCYYDCLWQQFWQPNYTTRRVPRLNVIQSYQQADLFVLTSRWEGAPVVLLEAMAASLPWVAYAVGNVHELRGGLIVSSATAFVEAVRELQHNPQMRQQLGQEGYAQVIEKYNMHRVIDQYEKLYFELATTPY
jgi:glycosyltransferase involved in cell wall biosynthesis